MPAKTLPAKQSWIYTRPSSSFQYLYTKWINKKSSFFYLIIHILHKSSITIKTAANIYKQFITLTVPRHGAELFWDDRAHRRSNIMRTSVDGIHLLYILDSYIRGAGYTTNSTSVFFFCLASTMWIREVFACVFSIS